MLEEQIENLIRTLGSHDPFIRQEAALALERIGSRAVPQLLAALQSLHIRSTVARVLGRIGDSRAVWPLIALLETAPLSVCQAIAEALMRLGDSRAARPLVESALRWNTSGQPFDPDGSESDLCRVIALALIGLQAYSDLLLLAQMLLDRNCPKLVRESVAVAISSIEDVAAIPVLLDLLKLRASAFQRSATIALQQLGDSETLPRRVLAEARLTVAQRVAILDELRRVRHTLFGAEPSYALPDIVSYCQQMRSAEDPVLRQEAEGVLSYFTLARPSQRDLTEEEGDLLRPAHGVSEVPPDTLLRPTDSSESLPPSPPPKVTFWQRCARLFRRR